MNAGWTETLDPIETELAERLARTPVPPADPPPAAPRFDELFGRWEASLDRLALDAAEALAALDTSSAELRDWRERLAAFSARLGGAEALAARRPPGQPL
jgi:hypothetical protein